MFSFKINFSMVAAAAALMLTHSPQAFATYAYVAQVTGPSSLFVATCTKYSVMRTIPSTGAPATGSVSAASTINLTSNSSTVSFYSNSTCTSKVLSVTIPVGTYFANFYLLDNKAEKMSVTATPVNLPTWELSSLPITDAYAYIAQVTGPSSSPATFCSTSPYSVVRTTPSTGLPAPGSVVANRVLNLTSNSSTVSFYSDSACTLKITSVTIPVGTYFANFYAMDSKAESISVTATPVNNLTWELGSMPISEVSRVQVIEASASDPTGVSKVNFYVNGALTCSATASPYSCSWNVPPGSGIKYQLQTTAYDPAGRTGTSSVVTVTSQ